MENARDGAAWLPRQSAEAPRWALDVAVQARPVKLRKCLCLARFDLLLKKLLAEMIRITRPTASAVTLLKGVGAIGYSRRRKHIFRCLTTKAVQDEAMTAS